MTNSEILQIILSSPKKLTAYYTYPSSSGGELIFETNNWNGQKYDEPMKNFINATIALGAALSGGPFIDNKTSVKVEVEGLDFPVYFRRHDGCYMICTGISTRRGSTEIPINWKLEH